MREEAHDKKDGSDHDKVKEQFKKEKSQRNYLGHQLKLKIENLAVVEKRLEDFADTLYNVRREKFPLKDFKEEDETLRLKLLQCEKPKQKIVEMKRKTNQYMRKMDFQKLKHPQNAKP